MDAMRCNSDSMVQNLERLKVMATGKKRGKDVPVDEFIREWKTCLRNGLQLDDLCNRMADRYAKSPESMRTKYYTLKKKLEQEKGEDVAKRWSFPDGRGRKPLDVESLFDADPFDDGDEDGDEDFVAEV